MREILTEVAIAAPPQRVWSILMDFAAYGEWNPFVTAISGPPETGKQLDVTLTLPGGKEMGFTPTVTACEEDHLFQWLGKVGFKGLFDGRHSFRLTPTRRGTRFVQSEQFTGILGWLMGGKMRRRTEAGFRAMNDALKNRAESR
ncbi:MAG: SRPBCC domain-containing protein [Acidimicrobiia bacterium]|nr:SRPBCC domain-containing protein [Acidimicrobiia bacterium]